MVGKQAIHLGSAPWAQLSSYVPQFPHHAGGFRRCLTSPLAPDLGVDAGFPSVLGPLIVQDLGQSHLHLGL